MPLTPHKYIMKNLLLTTIAITATFTFVSAEVTKTTRVIKSMPPVRSSSTEPQGNREGMPKLEIPTTGDSAIDSQIVSLFKEQEDKIKAIHQEYEAKIKALIGDRKISGHGSMATGTRPMMDDSKKRMEDGEHRNASGTHPMMRNGDNHNSTDTPLIMKRGEGRGGMEGNKDLGRPRPMGLIQNFFRSFFGGDAQEAQAQEINQ